MKMIMEAEELDEEAEKRLAVSEDGETPPEKDVDEEKKKLNEQQVQIDMNLRLNQVENFSNDNNNVCRSV